ncbi:MULTISPECIES: pyruvate dehydrogenase (acetyl-transferring) E1 component subunit alpha [Sporosarcina]|uniref:Pyruvate dehydrogenase E1 component subunit alpha n=1 Tax=Sporosarcina contaminans TaxID=633403 RepID=A0ABW3U3D7_9BACL
MFDENQLTFQMVRRLDEAGNLLDEKDCGIADDLLVEMYRQMKEVRILDEKLLKMQRQGRIGTYAPFSGQEAAQIGSALALERSDWICPSYRDLAACFVHGMPIEQILHYVTGHLEGGKTPEDVRILPVQIIIAAQTLHAVGLSMATKLRGETDVAISYFGDGATSEGDFHEALNFAAVYKTPTIFFCQNNQYAISVPLKQQMASKTIAQKAIAYGVKGIQVDGNDIIAVYEATKEAVERARNGEGPTLIEAVTYRLGPHTTSDDPSKYREDGEREVWRKKDPLVRMKRFLENKKLWSDERENETEKAFHERLNEAITAVENESYPNISEIFDHVYETPDEQLKEQKEEAANFYRQKTGGVQIG